MPGDWKQLDLEGGGLQEASRRIHAALRRRLPAYLLLAGAPLGLHRLYLGDRRGMLGCLAVTLASALAGTLSAIGLYALLAPAALIVVEGFRLEILIGRANRRIRMQQFLRRDAAPPAGYRGRSFGDADDAREELQTYLGEKESERAGHQPTPAPRAGTDRKRRSFAEQERLLAEMARRKRQH